MYIPIENISRGIDESDESYWTLYYSWRENLVDEIQNFCHLDCSEQTPKETQPLQLSERGSNSESLQAKGVQPRELKLNCRSKASGEAKSKFNMKGIRKGHHPMHGAVA